MLPVIAEPTVEAAQVTFFIRARWGADRRRPAGLAVAEIRNNLVSELGPPKVVFSAGQIPGRLNYGSIEVEILR
jgi:hypothetical protein